MTKKCAYWRDFTDGFYCSECGARNVSPANECPNCGREMINEQFWAGLSKESPGFGISNR